MKFTGKQIRIKFTDGEELIFRGSAFTLRIYDTRDDPDYNSVHIYLNDKDHDWWYWKEIEEVFESTAQVTEVL